MRIEVIEYGGVHGFSDDACLLIDMISRRGKKATQCIGANLVDLAS